MKNILKNKQAVASVEFALLILPLLVFITVLVESLVLTYETVAINYVGEQAAARTSTVDYRLDYESKFKKEVDKFLGTILFFADDDSLEYELKYCKDLNELELNSCSGDNDDNQIIVYELRYLLNPIFAYNWIDTPKNIKSRFVFYSERNRKALENE